MSAGSLTTQVAAPGGPAVLRTVAESVAHTTPAATAQKPGTLKQVGTSITEGVLAALLWVKGPSPIKVGCLLR